VLGLMRVYYVSLLERQAVRRLEGGSLTDEEVENMGQALMKLEEKDSRDGGAIWPQA